MEITPSKDSDNIITHVADGILTITLNRPEKLNACTVPMMDQIRRAIIHASRNDDIGAVIVTGSGRAFCAGADMSRLQELEAPGVGNRTDTDFVGALLESTKPVIAAINGAAVGLGVTMTLPMDIRIASTAAGFGFVFARRGLIPEAGSTWFLPRIVGIAQALRWSLSGASFGADEALAAGLVSEVVPPDALYSRARHIALEIVQNCSPIAVAMSRQLLWRMLAATDPLEVRQLDRAINSQLSRSAEVAEGLAAFREKRRPRFPSRVSCDLPPAFPWQLDVASNL